MPNSYSTQKNPYSAHSRGPGEPAAEMLRITPSDSVDLDPYCKALRVFVPSSLDEAALCVTPMLAADDASTVTLKFASGVSYEPLAVRRVWATGTTASIEIHAYLR